MPNYEQPQNEPNIERAEIDEETLKEIVTNIFFKARYPKTTQELLSRIQEQSISLGISTAAILGLEKYP